jgi:hypothetical protein
MSSVAEIPICDRIVAHRGCERAVHVSDPASMEVTAR